MRAGGTETSRPLTTAHITNAWHEKSGGISTFYRALLDAANRRGRAMRLIVPGRTDHVEEAGEFGLIYYVRAPRAKFNSEYGYLYPAEFLSPSGTVRRILAHEKPDVIEVCDKYSMPYLPGLLRIEAMPDIGRPTLVGMSCERMDDSVHAYLGLGALGRAWSRLYLRYLYFPMFDHHLANSEYTAAELIPFAARTRIPRGIWLAPPGVDAELFHPGRRCAKQRSAILARCGVSGDARLLLYAGRLAREKNVGLLPLMMELLPADFHLLIVGSGVLADELAAQASARSPGRLHMLGHVGGRVELADLAGNCDAFIHPNPREPFGIAPLEAMAAGTPLVCPDRGGVVSYANSSNAWPVPADPASFAEAVKDIFRDPQAASLRTARARTTAEGFAWPVLADRLLDLYAELHALRTGSLTEPSIQPLHMPGPALGPPPATYGFLLRDRLLKMIWKRKPGSDRPEGYRLPDKVIRYQRSAASPTVKTDC